MSDRAVIFRLVALDSFSEAMAKMTAAIERMGEQFARLIPSIRRLAAVLPEPHAFTVGSYDLACRVCGLGPEECR